MDKSNYSLEQIDQWREQLGNLARQPRTLFSKRDAVEALIEPIQLALQSHSYEVVAKSLESWGLVISAGSLKQYVSRYRRECGNLTSSKGKGKRRRSEAAFTDREFDRESQRELNSADPIQSAALIDSESSSLSAIAAEGESRQAPELAPIAADSDPFDLTAELDAVSDNETVASPQPWTEPTFNRNRVRPPRS